MVGMNEMVHVAEHFFMFHSGILPLSYHHNSKELRTSWEGSDLIVFPLHYISNSSSSFLSDETGLQLCVSKALLGLVELSQLTYI